MIIGFNHIECGAIAYKAFINFVFTLVCIHQQATTGKLYVPKVKKIILSLPFGHTHFSLRGDRRTNRFWNLHQHLQSKLTMFLIKELHHQTYL